MYAFDVETRAVDERDAGFAALEPWRVRQNRAEISSMAVWGPDGYHNQIFNEGVSKERWREMVIDFMEPMRGQVVYAQFAAFDVAWLIGTIEPEKFKPIPDIIRSIKWRDSALLVKWLINGQKPEAIKFSYSLKNLTKTFLPDHPKLEEFLGIKNQDVVAGENEEYWRARGLLDVELTYDLAAALQERLPLEQRIGFLTEMACIVPCANSWMNGIRVDYNRIEEVENGVQKIMDQVLHELGVEASTLSSPKQLAGLLFGSWGLKPRTMNKNGGSTSKEDLLWLQWEVNNLGNTELAARMDRVMVFKKKATVMSKYIKTLKEALEHTGDGYIYGSPKLFGTYTGRMTYSNNTLDKWKTGIALHQMPRREKDIRSLLITPEGFELFEDDASGQESRLMAIRSGDETMLNIFANDLNFHSYTAAGIIGMDYDEFQSQYEASEKEGGYFVEQRQFGKLTNLSCNYRIGGKALANKAFVDYDTYMTEDMGRFLVNMFQNRYPGVKDYWRDVILLSRNNGYTEAFGGRRYKLHLWGGQDSWKSESSAINFPIQGAGASMKEIAIAILTAKFPEVFFALDLHDATFSYGPEERKEELAKDMLSTLDKIDYKPYWGFEPPIPLTYDQKHGKSFKDVK